MTKFWITLFCLAGLSAYAQNALPVIPVPVKAQIRSGNFCDYGSNGYS